LDQLIVQGTGEAGVPELGSVEAIWADTEQSSMLGRDLIIKPGEAENLEIGCVVGDRNINFFFFFHVHVHTS
jgi:hypothetical protein